MPPPPHRPVGTPAPTWEPRVRKSLARGTTPPSLPRGRDVVAARRPAPPPIPREETTEPIEVLDESDLIAPKPLGPPAKLVFAIPGEGQLDPHDVADTAPTPKAAADSVDVDVDAWFDSPPPVKRRFESTMKIARGEQPQAIIDPFADVDDLAAEELRPARRARWPYLFAGAALVGAAVVGTYIAVSPSGAGEAASASSAGAAGDGDQAAPAARSAAMPAVADTGDEDEPMVAPLATGESEAAGDDEASDETDVAAAAHTGVFESEPAGATVTLIDDGTPTVLGSSPARAELVAGHTYEVVFAHEGYATTLVPVSLGDDGGARVFVTLQDVDAADEGNVDPLIAAALELPVEDSEAESAEPEAEPEPEAKRDPAAADARRERRERRARRAERAAAKKQARAAKRRARRAAAANDAADGYGTLMLGAKPPCEIYIDGRPTGMHTPQRDIRLKAGVHKVTLVNREYRIKKTLRVRVHDGKKTRVIRDMTKKM